MRGVKHSSDRIQSLSGFSPTLGFSDLFFNLFFCSTYSTNNLTFALGVKNSCIYTDDAVKVQKFQMPLTRLLFSIFNFSHSLFGWGESLVVGAVWNLAVKVSPMSDKSSAKKTFPTSFIISERGKCQLPVSFGEIRPQPQLHLSGHPQQNTKNRE